jgi:hypothetical protein
VSVFRINHLADGAGEDWIERYVDVEVWAMQDPAKIWPGSGRWTLGSAVIAPRQSSTTPRDMQEQLRRYLLKPG